ncbi:MULTISPECIES: metallophosphoesterase [unclassified Psychrobacter]|uniref:metallophosphoesterase n=1 Tax=unclassified Psychrobacter TaxID=196806 RepID=UPI00078C34C4|nr:MULTISPECIES: metallophosphoesterase [unclassified Psychrobacter]AMN50632.1 3',5'-cyclic-nucleotide phosphodiesterase [Psychrobacter sp. P2G3]AMN68531.1 3',5'-cyclic-nucleotide phosphodiesterase [Psychrobacter sp. P11G5]
MPSYPARKISSSDGQINVLQITDMHLSTVKGVIDKNLTSKCCCTRSFEAVLKQALSEDIRCDLILVTGDLVNEVKPDIYDHIFEVLHATNIPFACIAGNHDVTDELGGELPYFQRQLVPQPADARLLSRHIISTDYWQILLLNSAIPGKVAGEVTNADIDWLCAQLSACDKPALIALHHHVMLMHSEWIDAHIADNVSACWQRMAAFPHLRVIISGHTHQDQVRYHNGVTVYTTPSTCYQFKPYEDDFAYDKSALPGYRWLQLANNGQVASWVKRLDT